MTVVVRLPAIPADPDAGGGTAVVAPPAAPPTAGDGSDTMADGAAAAAPVEDVRPATVAPATREARPRAARRRPRFPLVTTLLLAVAAGACWLAVWRAERLDRRTPQRDEALAAFAEDVASDAPPAADGVHATASGTPGSVVR